jgi:rRNA maturation RNase YbeY
MEEAIIQFFSEGTDFGVRNPGICRSWLHDAAKEEGGEISFLNYVFCNDEYLLEINRQYLEHEDYTDIITFPYAEEAGKVEGDIFISIDRVRENANLFIVSFEHELHRVMIHGLLHLLGYNDKTASDKEKMTEKEDYYLELFPSVI